MLKHPIRCIFKCHTYYVCRKYRCLFEFIYYFNNHRLNDFSHTEKLCIVVYTRRNMKLLRLMRQVKFYRALHLTSIAFYCITLLIIL